MSVVHAKLGSGAKLFCGRMKGYKIKFTKEKLIILLKIA
jgi:hypothetical protein